MASTHIVESTPETVRSGYLDPAAKPVAVIQPGDTVRYPSWSCYLVIVPYRWNIGPVVCGPM